MSGESRRRAAHCEAMAQGTCTHFPLRKDDPELAGLPILAIHLGDEATPELLANLLEVAAAHLPLLRSGWAGKEAAEGETRVARDAEGFV